MRRWSDYCTIHTNIESAVRLIDGAPRSKLTRVPRSYQTSEMFGFSRIAREYASSASLY